MPNRQSLARLCAFAAGLLLARVAAAEDMRYLAVFSDGSRVTDGHLTDWGNPNNQPKLNGRPLFDQSNHIRWIKKQTPEQPSQPTAFVEIFGGDCLPGRVTAVGNTSTLEEGEIPAHVIVEPSIPLTWPEATQSSRVRVLTRWLRRIVWERRTSEGYQPGTIFYRDGRQLAFRSIRFNRDGVSVLTESERRDVRFTDLAELHMPRLDWWDAYFEQVALLTPDCKARLTRLETLDGLKVTTSADRFQPTPWGDWNNPESWFHAVQPAWSLDPLWVRHVRVLLRRFFGPHEVPLSLVEPSDTKIRSALAAGWRPQMDRNAQGGPLESGHQEAGWGIGMHAFTEMHFPLPACVQSFRSRIGLDQVVGKGGCARAIVYANSADGEPLFRSKHLIGSDETVDTGGLPLSGSAGAQLVLVAHPAHADRPEGADPFDIRDVVDWLEPQLNLDLGTVRNEVRKRLERLLPGWEGWNVAGSDRDKMIWVNRWDGTNQRDRRFHLECRPQEASLMMSRKVAIDADQNWLLLYATRNLDGGQTTPTQMIVKIDGKQVKDVEVPPRLPASQDTVPVDIPVDAYHGRTVNLEVRFVSRGDKSYVDWRSIALVEKLPSLAEIFEDAPQLPVQLKSSDGQNVVDGKGSIVAVDRFSGTASIKVEGTKMQVTLANLNLPIRESPRFGEYRYLCFAWKKRGGAQIALDLDFALGADTGPRPDERALIMRHIQEKKNRLATAQQQLESIKAVQKERPVGRGEGRRVQMLENRVQSYLDEIQQLELELAGGKNADATMHYRYLAGNRNSVPPEIRADPLGDRAPEQWVLVVRDLFQASGGGQLNSITLLSPDGDYALFDHIYLARTQGDFARTPPQAPPIAAGR